jgi:hypothetical protein
VKATPDLFDVLATVGGEGDVTRTNVVMHRTFRALNAIFDDHSDTRLLVVSSDGLPGVYVIDLWNTKVSTDYPYTLPWFVSEANKPMVFENLDHALGWCVLNINDIPNPEEEEET